MKNTKKPIRRCSRIDVRRNAFTLLELIIVILIMSLTAGLVGVNVTKAVREQRFKSEVGRVVDKLRLAQDLMLIADVGVDVMFTKENDGVNCWLEVDGPLTKQWKGEIERPSALLRAVHWVEFQETVPRQGAPEGKLQLQFLSRGSVMSRGLLRLSTSRSDDEYGALTRYVCLPGYPKTIVSTAKGECPIDRIEDIDRALTEWTVDELRAWNEKT